LPRSLAVRFNLDQMNDQRIAGKHPST
jgi:hypothetical protein